MGHGHSHGRHRDGNDSADNTGGSANPTLQGSNNGGQAPQNAGGGSSTPVLDAIRYGCALADHVLQQGKVYNLIARGLAITPDPTAGQEDTDNLFHNTAEWIHQGQAPMTVMTGAHEGYAAQIGADAGKQAFFDSRVQYPTYGGVYDMSATSVGAGVEVEDTDTLGGLSPSGDMTLYNPGESSDASLIETLVHEIQHDADRSWPGMIWAHPSGSTYSDYQSEFRAYWIESEQSDPNGHGSATSPAQNNRMVDWTDPVSNTIFFELTDFANLRQENIFWHLVDSGYEYVPEAYTQDANFKTMADEFTGPEGGNLVNSVRIQELTDAIVACNPSMADDDPAVENVFDKADALDAIDKEFLRDRERSGPFWDTAESKMGSDLSGQLRNVVVYGGRHVGDFPTDVTPAGPGTAYA